MCLSKHQHCTPVDEANRREARQSFEQRQHAATVIVDGRGVASELGKARQVAICVTE
jgi:hypothetical protein